jgi:hypothetical protein
VSTDPPLEPLVARKMHRTVEAYHGMIYFASEAAYEYAALGLGDGDFHKGYFASRASAMGEVPGEVVVATFFNFEPSLVLSAVPSCWTVASPADWQAARLRAVDRALRSTLGEQVEGPDMDEAASMARAASSFCEPAGRPLFAGHRSLPWPDAPHLQLWHAITLLREFRGDGHIAALVAAEVEPCEALVLHDGTGVLPPGVLQSTRAWSGEAWDAARDRLRGRGWMDGNELSQRGIDAREDIEHRTDELAMAPWRALGEEGCRRLRELVRPLSKAIVASGGITGTRSR